MPHLPKARAHTWGTSSYFLSERPRSAKLKARSEVKAKVKVQTQAQETRVPPALCSESEAAPALRLLVGWLQPFGWTSHSAGTM